MVDFQFWLRRAPEAASKSRQVRVYPEDVLEVVSKGLNIVHVCLSDVGHPEAREDSLQPDKEGLQVNDEKQGSQRIPWRMEKRMATTE